MFQISADQSARLAAEGQESYLQRVGARIRRDFEPEFRAVSDDDLQDLIHAAFDRFRVFNFRRKELLHRLIVLELLYGPSFEKALPEETRLFAFDSSEEAAKEDERFWAVYRASDCLTRSTESDPDDPFADITFAVERS